LDEDCLKVWLYYINPLYSLNYVCNVDWAVVADANEGLIK